jgi:glycosyltransferase involved in cell wall biosynthesis
LSFFLKYDYLFYDRLERWACKNKLVFAQGTTCFEKHKGHSVCHLVTSTAHYDTDVIPAPPVKFKNKTKEILTVGRLTGIKNQALLIKLIALVKKEMNAGNYILSALARWNKI